MITKPIPTPEPLADSPHTASQKSALRTTMRQKRGALGGAERAAASAAIGAKIIERLQPIGAATPIAIYLAKSEEVDLDPVALHLLRAHRHVVVPCHSAAQLTASPAAGGHEGFAPLRFNTGTGMTGTENADDNLFDVRSAAFGVREPVDCADRLIPPATIGVFVLPGLAFDPQGYRLGYGGGWFDKALAGRLETASVRPLLLGVCFDCQVVDAVPREAHDVRMDLVVTESRLIEIS